MLGIDIVEISRFKNITKKTILKILHIDEIEEFLESKNKVVFLAVRWAIKEALFKANNNLYAFSKIRIQKRNNKYFYKNYLISTSVEDKYCVACVLKMNEDKSD